MDQNKMEIEKTFAAGLEIPDQKNQVRWIKAIILAFIALVGFAITWQLLALGFAESQGLMFWILPGITAALGVVFLALLSVVNRNKFLLLGTSLATLVAYLAVMPRDWYVAAGGVLFFLTTFLFEMRIKHDENSRADFSLSRIMRASVWLMVYGLLAVVAFNIYAKTRVEFAQNPKQFYNQIGHYAAQGLEYVPSGLGNFKPDQTFDDFVVAQAKRQDPQFASASQPQKQELSDEVKKQIFDRFHIQVEGNPLLGKVVAGAVSDKVQSAATSYQSLFPAIFAVIVAALLRTMSFLFVWLVMLVSWIVFKLLMLVKFFKLHKVPVEVEKLEI